MIARMGLWVCTVLAVGVVGVAGLAQDVEGRGQGQAPSENQINEWVAQLKDPNAGKRQEAIHQLMRARAKEHAVDIAPLLKDNDKWIRVAAGEALSRMPDPRTLPAIIEAMQKDDSDVRMFLINGLAQLKEDERALAPLILAACEGGSAISVVGRMHREEAVPALIAALDSPDRYMREEASKDLDEMGYNLEPIQTETKPEPTPFNPRQGMGRPRPPTIEVRYRLIPSLKAPPLPTEPQALIESFATGKYFARLAAQDALAKLGDQSIGPLKAALKENRLIVRMNAVDTLGKMSSPAARDALKAAAASDDKLVAFLATPYLSLIPDASMAETWKTQTKSENGHLRALAIEGLARLGDNQYAPLFRAGMNDPVSEVRCKAIWALGEVRDDAGWDALVERLRKAGYPDPEFRVDFSQNTREQEVRALVDAITKFGPSRTEDLAFSLGEPGSWQGSGQNPSPEIFAAWGPPAMAELVKLLDSPDQQSRRGAAMVLRGTKPPEAIVPLLKGIRTQNDMMSFSALAGYGESAHITLKQCLADPKMDNMNKEMASVLLMALGDKSGAGILESMVANDRTNETHIVVTYMGYTRCKDLLPIIAKALKRPDAWGFEVNAAGNCGGQDALRILQEALNHPSEMIRQAAQSQIQSLARQQGQPPRNPPQPN